MRSGLELQHHYSSIAAISAALGALVAGVPAYAQSREADALFSAGRKLMNEGEWGRACEAFETSNRIEQRVGTLLRLGECREQNQQLAAAWSAYTDALARAQDPRRRDLAMTKVAELESRLSYLTVSISDDSWIEGLTLTWNGEPVDPVLWNQALAADGGDHVIAGRAPGHEGWQTVVHVPAEGGRVRVEVPRLEDALGLAPHRAPRRLFTPRRALLSTSGCAGAPWAASLECGLPSISLPFIGLPIVRAE